MKMSTKPKSAAKIRGKRKRPAQAPPAEVQGELLPAEDSFERALASLRTERQRAFVRALMATWPQLDGKAAAVAAGCRAGAYETTHRWWRRPDIARAVNLWVRERLQNSLPSGDATPEQQAEEVLRTAWLMARANVLWFTRISPDRKLLIPDFSHATDDMLACIEAFDISDRGIRLKLKDSSKALALLARATGVDRPEVKMTSNVELRVVYERTPEKLSRELGQLNPDNQPKSNEALDDPAEPLPLKKFPIN